MAPAAYSFFSPQGISLLLLPIRVVSPIAQVVKNCAVILKSQVSALMMYEGEAVVEQFKVQFNLHPKCATTRSKINLMCKILQIALVKAQVPVSHFRCQNCSCSNHIFFSLRYALLYSLQLYHIASPFPFSHKEKHLNQFIYGTKELYKKPHMSPFQSCIFNIPKLHCLKDNRHFNSE